jgi:hypothetical protein
MVFVASPGSSIVYLPIILDSKQQEDLLVRKRLSGKKLLVVKNVSMGG